MKNRGMGDHLSLASGFGWQVALAHQGKNINADNASLGYVLFGQGGSTIRIIAPAYGSKGLGFFFSIRHQAGMPCATYRFIESRMPCAIWLHITRQGKGHTPVLGNQVNLGPLSRAMYIEALPDSDKIDGNNIRESPVGITGSHGKIKDVCPCKHIIQKGLI